MSLPSAVVAQGERAESLLQAASARRQGNTDQPAPAQATAVTPQETPKEQATPPAASTPSPAPIDPAIAQRLKVLEGKYNAEVPRLAAQAKAEAARAERLAAELAEEKKKNAAKPLVSAEEVKEFGEPLVDLQRRIAEEATRPLLAKIDALTQANEAMSAQVKSTAQVGQHLNTNAFFSALSTKVPNWQAINATPEFLKWLDGVDPLARRSRQELLDAAQNSLDADGVAQFFVAFEADVQSRAAPRAEALEAQVTPSTTPGTPATDPALAGKKVWTPALIAKFYDDVRRRLINDADAARIELDIQAAPREGRYRQR